MVIRLLLLSVFLSGCTTGYIYTNTVSPYCTDMQEIKTESKKSTSSLKQISIPTVPGSRTIWNSNSIADAAKQGGIEKIQYCDRKKFSIMGGVWGSDSIIVYGE